MPIVRVEMWQGRTLEQKRQIVRELTEVVARVSCCDAKTVRVLIDSYPRENWVADGVLQSDREASGGVDAGEA